MKTLDSGAGARRVRAGRLRPRTRSDDRPRARREHHGRRRLPVDDAALGGRHRADDEHRRSRRPASASLVEARGEIFTIPAEKGDVRNLTHSSGSAERDPAWSPDGKYVSYFSDKSGEYRLVIEAQDGLTPPREIALAESDALLHAVVVARLEEDPLSPTPTSTSGCSTSRAARRRSSATDPWMVPQRTLDPVWSPDSKWVAYASHLELALSRDLRRQRRDRRDEAGDRRPGRRGVAGVGRERQVPLVLRVAPTSACGRSGST